jgi:hypothetical protein
VEPKDSPETWPGEWWRADAPDMRVRGTLAWSERADLRLEGSFGDIASFNAHPAYPVIHGRTLDGRALTLLGGMRTHLRLHMSGDEPASSREEIAAWTMFEGAWVGVDDRFSDLVVEVPGLEYWLPQARIETALDTTTSPPTATVALPRPPPEVLPLPGVGAMAWEVLSNMSGYNTAHVTVTSTAWVRFKPDDPGTLETLLGYWTRLSTFLTFVWGSPVGARDLHVRTCEGTSLRVRIALAEAGHCDLKVWHEFLLPKTAGLFDANEAIAAWFGLDDALRLPSLLARGAISVDQHWLHFDFLGLMQALEGFHRVQFDGTFMPQDAFAPVYDALMAALPAGLARDHRDALKSRLFYGNEISLRRRVSDICRSLPGRLAQHVLGVQKGIPFGWVETRNYFTHWDEASKANVLENQELVDACVRLKALLMVLYLQRAGVPDELLLQCFTGTAPIAKHLIQIKVRAGAAGAGRACADAAAETTPPTGAN